MHEWCEGAPAAVAQSGLWTEVLNPEVLLQIDAAKESLQRSRQKLGDTMARRGLEFPGKNKLAHEPFKNEVISKLQEGWLTEWKPPQV